LPLQEFRREDARRHSGARLPVVYLSTVPRMGEWIENKMETGPMALSRPTALPSNL
jgi:hypothetical protein